VPPAWPGPARPGGAAGVGAPTGRTAFRWDGDRLIDDRPAIGCPGAREYEARSAADVAHAIRDMIIRGAPAIGQVAAIGLALSANRLRATKPYARKASLRGAASGLKHTRPTAVNLAWAVDRMLARFEAIGTLNEDGGVVADALWAEAQAIVFEATDDHGRLATFGAELLPDVGDRPLRLLTHCNTGPLACGQFGTALGVVQVVHHAGRAVHVWVDETRPYLQGARLTAGSRQAGVHTIADVAAASPRRGGDAVRQRTGSPPTATPRTRDVPWPSWRSQWVLRLRAWLGRSSDARGLHPTERRRLESPGGSRCAGGTPSSTRRST
jgi:methylthioribose-1-phosphate isomerase